MRTQSQHTATRFSILKGETRTPQFLFNVSGHGQIPVLQLDTSTFLPESNAACYYLADTTKSPALIPSDPLRRAEMLRWMFFEQNQHETTIAVLRNWLKHIGKDNLDDSQRAQIDDKTRKGRAVLDSMDEHLANSTSGWLVGPSITLADVCLFAYTHVAHEAGFDLAEWPAVKAWCKKVATTKGYTAM